ncbi:MAG: ABC transporter permease subunit [Lachnospiraceae bacterium]|nr:ABC transporter permease subunit [Lachnospiraceae bacterium]
MYKVLSANFSRLRKDKTFWLCMAVMLVYSVVYMLNGCRQAVVDLAEYDCCIDEYYFHFAILTGAFCALFASMFLGTEYSDGTIRNKIIAGHTRAEIYIANLLTVFSATLFIMMVWLIGALVGIPVLGTWKIGVSGLLLYLVIAVFFTAAFSAIFTCLSMNCENKAITAAASIFLFLGVFIFTSMIYNALSQPQMVSGVEITANGMEMSEAAPNPNYISGTMRAVYEFILDFLPTGQGLKMWQVEISNPVRMVASSVFITVTMTAGGIYLFRKKNLK